MVLDGTVRRQDASGTLALLLGHRDTGVATWRRLEERWGDVMAALHPGSARRMLDFIYFRSEPEVAGDIGDWLAAHPLPGSDRHVAQQLERPRGTGGSEAASSGGVGRDAGGPASLGSRFDYRRLTTADGSLPDVLCPEFRVGADGIFHQRSAFGVVDHHQLHAAFPQVILGTAERSILADHDLGDTE